MDRVLLQEEFNAEDAEDAEQKQEAATVAPQKKVV